MSRLLSSRRPVTALATGPALPVRRLVTTGSTSPTGCAAQRLVLIPPPDVLPVGLHVTGAAAASGGRPVGEEELRLLDGRHEQAGVGGQGRVQGRGPRLRGANDEEVRQGHGEYLLG